MTDFEGIDEDEYLRVVGTYKHGSICRIKLVNFLTYNNAEVRPGPRYVVNVEHSTVDRHRQRSAWQRPEICF